MRKRIRRFEGRKFGKRTEVSLHLCASYHPVLCSGTGENQHHNPAETMITGGKLGLHCLRRFSFLFFFFPFTAPIFFNRMSFFFFHEDIYIYISIYLSLFLTGRSWGGVVGR